MSDPDKLVAVRAALPSLAAADPAEHRERRARSPPRSRRRWPSSRPTSATSGGPSRVLARDSLQRMDEARAAVAAVLGGDLDEVAITHATTDGMNLGTWAIDWQRRRARGHDAAMSIPAASGRCTSLPTDSGSTSGSPSSRGDAPDDEILAQFDRADHAGHQARLVLARALDHGPRDARRADRGARPRARGAGIVDGAQAAGAIPVNVRDLGVDMYSVPAQKWLLGPEGLGALWVRRELLETAESTLRRLLLVRSSTPAGTGRCRPMRAGSRSRTTTGRRCGAWPARSAG